MGTWVRTAVVGSIVLVLTGTHGYGTPGAQAGAAVRDALDRAGWVRVVVSLREPSAPFSDLTARRTEIADTRRAVLARLGPDEFRLEAQWDTASAVAGLVSAPGVEALLADPEVRRVDVDVAMQANRLGESVPVIGADQAHGRGVTGAGIVVAVIDSGAQSDHPDIAPALVAEQCFCATASGGGCCPGGGTSASGAGAANDDNGHGTNVSGVIVGRGHAAPRGVAPEAGLVSIKILDAQGIVSSTTQIVSALDYILTSRPDVKVVNISVGTGQLFAGGPCDNAASFVQAMASVVNGLTARGTVVVASSGNSANSSSIAAPACIAGVIAVGATYDGDTGSVSFGCVDASTSRDQVACFSNASAAVDLLAPGGAITAPGLGGGASTFIGTSQAAPHVAGAAALLLQARGGSPASVLAALQGTGQPIADPRNGMTFKRIDIGAATQ